METPLVIPSPFNSTPFHDDDDILDDYLLDGERPVLVVDFTSNKFASE